MKTLVLAVQLVLQVGTVNATTLPNDSVYMRADSAVRSFLVEWRHAWQRTQLERPAPPSNFDGRTGVSTLNDDLRTVAVHCHWVTGIRDPAAYLYGYVRRHIIRGTVAAQATCPMWYPDDPKKLDDERRGIDGGLTRPKRMRIGMLRNQLRAYLESLAQQAPDDLRLTRQRLRFALDAGAFRDAWTIATTCTAQPAQCTLLQGLVQHQAGRVADADSAFLAAAALMSEDERCSWNDIGPLLELEMRREYLNMSCAARSELEERIWWLADPLYSEPGNERRAEHFARKTHLTLLTPLGFDERLHYERKRGGESVIESLIRYGWPSQFFWPGHRPNNEHAGWLVAKNADTAAPYVVHEYTRGRLHTFPSPAAIVAPLVAKPDHWQLNEPPKDSDWWPVEHYARDRSPIVQLQTGQMVMLLRRNATRFVWATDLDSVLVSRSSGDSVHATLLYTRSPADLTSAGTFGAAIGCPLVVDARMPSGQTLIAVEFAGDTVRPAARTRFGTDIPTGLEALADARAISQPLLFKPRDGANTLAADAAIERMFGTTSFRKMQRLGVYWEAYGFPPTDSVTVELRVEREVRPGIFARVAGLFGLADTDDTSVGMKWRELAGEHPNIHVFEGSVPMQMRGVVLDVSKLARGTYKLLVFTIDDRGHSVKSERIFELH